MRYAQGRASARTARRGAGVHMLRGAAGGLPAGGAGGSAPTLLVDLVVSRSAGLREEGSALWRCRPSSCAALVWYGKDRSDGMGPAELSFSYSSTTPARTALTPCANANAFGLAFPTQPRLRLRCSKRYRIDFHPSWIVGIHIRRTRMQARRGRRVQRDLLSLPLLPFTLVVLPPPSVRGALFHSLLCPRALIHLDHDSHGVYDPANLRDRRMRSVEPCLALPPPSPRSFVFHRAVLD
ncbi:hypothetical protein B0H13DRAFT_866520 [Mycena leptocephala]|nr:hypothetical protein B0H13DRAFT_866520 [Mycena leptocephala]